MAGLARAQPVQVIRDDRGREVSLPRPPQRIVSLLPSLTETICALDQCHRLVGVDRYSNWPEASDCKSCPRWGRAGPEHRGRRGTASPMWW